MREDGMNCSLAYIVWNVNPDLVKLGPLTIRWYGVLFALGFYLGFLIVSWMFRVEKKNLATLNHLLIFMIAGALIGARLGQCIFYDPVYYFKHPLEILAIWEGGLASHGGAAGILLAIHWYSRRHPDQPFLWLMDRIVVPTALAGVLIRVGNLFNSEILGVRTTVPWAFVFVQDDPFPRHPVQIYEAIAYLLIFILLISIYSRRRAQTPPGLIFGLFLVLVFAFRFFIEFLKQPQATYEQGFPLRVGQWLSIPFVLFGLWLLWQARTKGKDPHAGLNKVAHPG